MLLAVGEFALTANNGVTYAALGDAPVLLEASSGRRGPGIVPVWGFAGVIRVARGRTGERPWLLSDGQPPLVAPAQVCGSGFVDASEHRRKPPVGLQPVPALQRDPLYRASDEAPADAPAAVVHHLLLSTTFAEHASSAPPTCC
ncbi:hypothetical protein P4114_25180 [Pseudomonas aeruginosa]|nr:hypothetical protein [Pseudomonas aeruginosa]